MGRGQVGHGFSQIGARTLLKEMLFILSFFSFSRKRKTILLKAKKKKKDGIKRKSRHYPQIQGFRELNAAKSHLCRPLSRTHTAMTRKLTLFIVTCFSNHERETSSQVSSAATAPCSISLTISIWSLNHLRRSPFSSTLFF